MTGDQISPKRHDSNREIQRVSRCDIAMPNPRPPPMSKEKGARVGSVRRTRRFIRYHVCFKRAPRIE
jgi:hypothetical protein